MLDNILTSAFDIGRHMSETDQTFEGFIEYRVSAFTVLKQKLDHLNIYPYTKQKLLSTLSICQKLQSIYEYYVWQKDLFVIKDNYSMETVNSKIDSYAESKSREIKNALSQANMTMDEVTRCYKKVLVSVDMIALEMKKTNCFDVGDRFILEAFNAVPNKKI